jgi:hypothetical protein
MNREQAINYLISSGFTHEQVCEVVRALTYESTTKNDLGVDCISRDDVRDVMQELWGTSGELMDRLMALPSVIPQLSSELDKNSKKLEKDFGELDCISRIETIDYLCKHCPDDGECFKDCDEIKHLRQMPSVTPQSSVPEVTALAEWTEKLTKASEDAYNKGYADGVKSVNICPHCGEYIGEE